MGHGVGLSRERVIEAAAALLDAHGPGALTIARLADACGVRGPSLYKHVVDLSDVEVALTLRTYDALVDALTATDAPHPADAALAFARAWRVFAHAHPGLYTLASRTHVRGDAAVIAAGGRVLDVLLARVRPLVSTDADAVHLARALRALVHGFVTLELADGYGLPTDVDVSFDAAVRRLLR